MTNMQKTIGSLLAVLMTLFVLTGACAVEAGDVVTFGSFRQNKGEEPIEWMVLDADGDTAVLLSRYILDCRPADEWGEARWNRTQLCKWLDSTFSNAFTNEEYRHLVPNENDELIGIPTLDDVTDPDYGFSASQDAHDMTRVASGTKYAKGHNLWVNDDNGFSTYYTCTNNRHNKDTFCTVRSDGAIGYARPDRDNVGVRVLIYVETDAFPDDSEDGGNG